MPNWCENRVRLSDNGDNSEQFDRLCKLLDGPDPFNTIFPRPDFPNIPNDKGELPIKEEIKNDKGEVVAETYNFPDGKNDDRWYHWCVDNWGTKWDMCDKFTAEIDEGWQSLDLTPRGGHRRESMKRSRKISQMLEFRGSMMSPEWNLQVTYRIKFYYRCSHFRASVPIIEV